MKDLDSSSVLCHAVIEVLSNGLAVLTDYLLIRYGYSIG